MQNTQRQKGND